MSYRSVIAFGTIRVVEASEQKVSFCAAQMQKYGDPAWARPPGFFPRLDEITVYAIGIERLTGRETPLPDTSR